MLVLDLRAFRNPPKKSFIRSASVAKKKTKTQSKHNRIRETADSDSVGDFLFTRAGGSDSCITDKHTLNTSIRRNLFLNSLILSIFTTKHYCVVLEKRLNKEKKRHTHDRAARGCAKHKFNSLSAAIVRSTLALPKSQANNIFLFTNENAATVKISRLQRQRGAQRNVCELHMSLNYFSSNKNFSESLFSVNKRTVCRKPM